VQNALHFHLLRIARLFLGGEEGVIALQVGGEERAFAFNPRNTQFHSVYAPPYRDGYEPETGALLDRLVPADGVMFDIGANWGHFSLQVASRPGFRGQIHAFEPMPSTYRDLEASIKGARLEAVVHPHNVAMSDSDGAAHMTMPDGEHSGLATIVADDSGVPMRRARLDSLGLPAPSVMKIDVEGHEAAVLRGAAQTIREARPMIIFESWIGPSVEQTLSPFFSLEECGYRFFQPAFQQKFQDHEYLVGYEGYTATNRAATLILVPVKARERLLLARQFNVLACHESRLSEMASTLRS
jgi:FkbM family methyltransferase